MVALRTGEPVWNVAIGVDRPDGSKVWLSVNAQPVRHSSSGPPEMVVVSFFDVTPYRDALQTLYLSEQRFRSLVEATTQMVWTADQRGYKSGDSPSWRAYTGQSLEEFFSQAPGSRSSTQRTSKKREPCGARPWCARRPCRARSACGGMTASTGSSTCALSRCSPRTGASASGLARTRTSPRPGRRRRSAAACSGRARRRCGPGMSSSPWRPTSCARRSPACASSCSCSIGTRGAAVKQGRSSLRAARPCSGRLAGYRASSPCCWTCRGWPRASWAWSFERWIWRSWRISSRRPSRESSSGWGRCCGFESRRTPLVGRWDPLRLEQVVVNLLSNAVRYGRGRPVELTLWREGAARVLSVKDPGDRHLAGGPGAHLREVRARRVRAVLRRAGPGALHHPADRRCDGGLHPGGLPARRGLHLHRPAAAEPARPRGRGAPPVKRAPLGSAALSSRESR